MNNEDFFKMIKDDFSSCLYISDIFFKDLEQIVNTFEAFSTQDEIRKSDVQNAKKHDAVLISKFEEISSYIKKNEDEIWPNYKEIINSKVKEILALLNFDDSNLNSFEGYKDFLEYESIKSKKVAKFSNASKIISQALCCFFEEYKLENRKIKELSKIERDDFYTAKAIFLQFSMNYLKYKKLEKIDSPTDRSFAKAKTKRSCSNWRMVLSS